jgi:hypothetical protein
MLAVHETMASTGSHVAALAERLMGLDAVSSADVAEAYCNEHGINPGKESFRLMVQAVMLADARQVKYDEYLAERQAIMRSGLRCGEYHRSQC